MNRCDRDNRSKRLAFLAYFFLLLTFFFPSISKAAEDRLLIAAAASLRYPLDAIAIAFQTEQSVSVKISYGASGSLFAQLKQGAPFDLFLSADHLYSKMLMEDQLASDYFEFGLGRIVLWVPKKSTIDISKEGVNGLLHASTRKIAIANPAYAPYGAAAISALKRFGLYQEIKGKLVFGEDIAQAAHFVESGAAEIGILAYSIVAQKQIDRKSVV